MTRMYALLLLFVSGSYGLLEAQSPSKQLPCARVDLVLMFDRSGSVANEEEDEMIRHAVVDLSTTYDVSKDALQIGLGTFNALPTTLTEITGNRDSLKEAVASFPDAIGGTSMYAAFYLAQELFENQIQDQPSRIVAKKILVVVSDGVATGYVKAKAIADTLKNGSWIQQVSEAASVNPVEVYMVKSSAEGGPREGLEKMIELATDGDHYKVIDYSELFSRLKQFNICG